nr:MAG TPA: hypothetical protein [Caudoviricetes sp.]
MIIFSTQLFYLRVQSTELRLRIVILSLSYNTIISQIEKKVN